MIRADVVTDGTVFAANYVHATEVKPGDVVCQGPLPFLAVALVEYMGGQVRFHFEGGHVGGWMSENHPVPVVAVHL